MVIAQPNGSRNGRGKHFALAASMSVKAGSRVLSEFSIDRDSVRQARYEQLTPCEVRGRDVPSSRHLTFEQRTEMLAATAAVRTLFALVQLRIAMQLELSGIGLCPIFGWREREGGGHCAFRRWSQD